MKYNYDPTKTILQNACYFNFCGKKFSKFSDQVQLNFLQCLREFIVSRLVFTVPKFLQKTEKLQAPTKLR